MKQLVSTDWLEKNIDKVKILDASWHLPNSGRNAKEEYKLNQFHSQNPISYSQYDKVHNQLKMFFGFDPEDPEKSFYPDLLIIEDSDYIRNMYKKKINDMTTNRINYNISR